MTRVLSKGIYFPTLLWGTWARGSGTPQSDCNPGVQQYSPLRVFKGRQAFPVDLQQQVDHYPIQYPKLCWIKCWWNRHWQEEAEKHCHASAIWSSRPLASRWEQWSLFQGNDIAAALGGHENSTLPSVETFCMNKAVHNFHAPRSLVHSAVQ